MPTLSELREQRKLIDEQIAEIQEHERSQAISLVRAKIDEFNLTQSDVFGTKGLHKLGVKRTVAAKYRDEESGKEWSGRGKEPVWIAGKNRSQFLIDKPTVE